MARAVDATSAAFDAAFPAETKQPEANSKPGKFWRPFGGGGGGGGGGASSSTAAAAAAASAASQLQKSGAGGSGGGSGGGGVRGRRSRSVADASANDGSTASGAAESRSASLAPSSVGGERSRSLNGRRRELYPPRRSGNSAYGGDPEDNIDSSGSGTVFRDGFYESSEGGGGSSVVDGGPYRRRRGGSVGSDCTRDGGSEGGSRRGRVSHSRRAPAVAGGGGGGKRGASWRRMSAPVGSRAGSRSPPPGTPAPRSRVRRRASVTALEEEEGEGPGQRGGRKWFSGPKRSVRRRPVGGGGGGGGGSGDWGEAVTVQRDLESVAKVPPWMEGVQASPEYEEMKPTLDVIKRTVLLAVLHQVGARRVVVDAACVCSLVCD